MWNLENGNNNVINRAIKKRLYDETIETQF